MMGTSARHGAPYKLGYTGLPLERPMLLEPPANYTGVHLTDDLLTGRVLHVRGQKVMLDRDLAELFGVEVRVLKQAVRRNSSRFPESFMLELTPEEDHALRSRIVTLRQGKSFAFTEYGILMLAIVLKSERAIAISIRIIDLFVRMRAVVLAHKDILLRLEQLERRIGERGTDIQLLFQHLKQLLTPPSEPRKPIGHEPDQA